MKTSAGWLQPSILVALLWLTAMLFGLVSARLFV
jgi:hypothetical protein